MGVLVPSARGQHRQADARRNGQHIGEPSAQISGRLGPPIMADHMQEQATGHGQDPWLPEFHGLRRCGAHDKNPQARGCGDSHRPHHRVPSAVAIRISEHQNPGNRNRVGGDGDKHTDIDAGGRAESTEEPQRHAVRQLVPEQADIAEFHGDPRRVSTGAGAPPGPEANNPLETCRRHQSDPKDAQRPESNVRHGGGKQLGQHDHPGRHQGKGPHGLQGAMAPRAQQDHRRSSGHRAHGHEQGEPHDRFSSPISPGGASSRGQRWGSLIPLWESRKGSETDRAIP